MNISGNAGDWWDNAAGSYRRGHQPATGAVLVFQPYGRMRAGHVAVVAKLVNAREILVNQANWPHGDVVEGAAVYDVSANNDWTTVRVAEASSQSWGRTNPTFGFIYRDGAPARAEPVVAQAQPQFPQPQSWATQPWPRAEPPVTPVQAQTAQAQTAQLQTAQLRTVQAQPAQPQPRTAQPQTRFQRAIAETQAADDEDEPAPPRHHASPTPRTPEKAKADSPATRKELAKAKHEHGQELAVAKTAKAKPGRHEKLEAKADRGKAEHEKLAAAKADREKAQQEKLAKASHDKAERTKLAAAKAEHDKLAKVEHDKAHREKLAKAEHDKQEKLAAAKVEHDKARAVKLAKAEHVPAVRHAHVARNDQPSAQGANIEQIAEAGRSGE